MAMTVALNVFDIFYENDVKEKRILSHRF